MKTKPLAVLLMVVGLLMVSGPAFAHHSEAAYDLTREITLKGTVTEFKFINPHTRVHFQVKDEEGNVAQWVGEMAPPNNLRRAGWTRNSIQAGDEITTTVHVARDGSKQADIVTLEVNGKVLRGRERQDE